MNLKIRMLDLEKAEQLASEFTNGNSGELLDARQFHVALKKGELNVLENLWLWFSPTCQWDDFIGLEVKVGLADKIFEQ